MSNCTEFLKHLCDYVDGELPTGMCEEVETHLRVCSSCRAEAEAIHALKTRARALRVPVEPPAHVWTSIAESIEPRARARRRLLRFAPALGVAAAILVVLGGSMLMQFPAPSQRPLNSDTAADANESEADAAAIDAEFAQARRELKAVLTARQAGLDPETVQIIETNMAIVDEAVREIRIAIATDPGNRDLSRLLLAAHREQVSLLRQATQLAVSK